MPATSEAELGAGAEGVRTGGLDASSLDVQRADLLARFQHLRATIDTIDSCEPQPRPLAQPRNPLSMNDSAIELLGF